MIRQTAIENVNKHMGCIEKEILYRKGDVSMDGKKEKLYLQQKGSDQEYLGHYAYGDV